MRSIKVLQLADGKEPFSEWIDSLDKISQARVYSYIDRVVAGGGRKNVRSLGSGVYEIKVDYGPGYRIYFGEDGNTVILILLGGNKKSQAKDIELAKDYWRKYVSK